MGRNLLAFGHQERRKLYWYASFALQFPLGIVILQHVQAFSPTLFIFPLNAMTDIKDRERNDRADNE